MLFKQGDPKPSARFARYSLLSPGACYEAPTTFSPVILHFIRETYNYSRIFLYFQVKWAYLKESLKYWATFAIQSMGKY